MKSLGTSVKKVQFEKPQGHLLDLLDKITRSTEQDILDVPVSQESIDAFSLVIENDVFYLGAMTLKRLKKGGWGGAKTCARSYAANISTFVEQISRLMMRSDMKRIGSVDYYKLKTEIDFLLLKEFIAKKVLFLDRNADKRIAFSEKPLPLSFEWVYEEAHQGYVFKELIEPPFLLVKFPTPMVFDVSKGIFYEIVSPMDKKTMTYLLQLPPIKPEYTEYVAKQLKDKQVPQLKIPKTLQLKKIQPIPILIFKRIYEAYEWHACAELHFKYEEKECTFHSSLKRFETVKEEELIYMERDMAFEKHIQTEILAPKMETLRFKNDSYYRYQYYGASRDLLYREKEGMLVPKKVNTASTLAIKENYWHKFLGTETLELKKHGFHIRFEEDFPYKPVSEDEWYVDLESSDQQWFDTSIGILVNGEKINLLPLLLKSIHLKDTTFLEGYKMDVSLRLEDGRDVVVQRDRINQLLTFLRTILKISADKESSLKNPQTVQLTLLDALQLAHFKENDFKEADWSGSQILLGFADKLKGFKGIKPINPPQELTTTLRPYQQEGLNWLQFLREHQFSGILADEMGLGKTIQTLAHLLTEKQNQRLTFPVLLVVPTSLIPNWESEINKFAPNLSVKILHGANRTFENLETFDVIMTTYALIARDFNHLKKQPYSTIILDEAQNIKNKNTQAAQFLMHLSSKQRLCLTGTPLENHLSELWSLFHFLMPGFLGAERYFKKEYRTRIEKGKDIYAKKMLATRIKPFILRRTKNEVALELPTKTEIIQKCELTEQQRDLYEMVRLAMHQKVHHAIEKKGLNKSHIIILDALLKLRQVCCDPRLLKMKHKVTESAKLSMLKELLEEMVEEGRKILIFSQFTEMLELIAAELVKMGIAYVNLYGDTKDRKKPIEAFQGGVAQVFLISLKAGGVGLNLTAADVVIHYDPWWNPAVENQATDRAHRIGQDKPIFVYKMIMKDTLEEKILELQAKKASIVASIFDNEAKQSTTPLTEADINALLGTSL